MKPVSNAASRRARIGRMFVMLCLVAAGASLLGAPAQAKAPTRSQSAVSAASALEIANSKARRKPENADFVDAAQIYDYAPGAIYQLYAAPEFLSTILLEDGEVLATSAAGDTTRWMMETVQAAGARGGRTLILIKPVQSGIRTNLILVTDRRTYLIEAIAPPSGTKTYSAQIAWRYGGKAFAGASGARVPLDALYFGYDARVVKGRTPAWMPARVFDDGLRTYVEFGENLPATEAPPLFVIGPKGLNLSIIASSITVMSSISSSMRPSFVLATSGPSWCVSSAVRNWRRR